MRLQGTRRELWARHDAETASAKEKEPRHLWDLNKGLIGLSSILIAWAILAVFTVQGLGHLSSLPWT